MDEVVGADGNEIGGFEQAGNGECGGGDFYHAACFYAAEGFAALGELAFGGFQMDEALPVFGQAGNHGEHEFDAAMHGGAQHGAHLGSEQHGFGVAQADAGEPEGGIGCGAGRAAAAEPAWGFVYAEVYGADGERFAFHFFGDFAVKRVLLVFAGRGIAV